MEGKTTASSRKNTTSTEVVHVSQEELKQKLENVGIGDSTLSVIIFNPTPENVRTVRDDNKLKAAGSLEVTLAQAVPTETFEIDMANATIKYGNSKEGKKDKDNRDDKEKNAKDKTTTQHTKSGIDGVRKKVVETSDGNLKGREDDQ